MFGVLFVTAETALELFIPVIMANIIDVGVPAGDINYMLLQGAYMLVCAAFSLVLGLGYARTSARVASGLGANLREAEYRKIQTLAFGNLDNYDASSLVTRMTTDITVIQNAIGNGFRPMVRGPVTLVVGLIYALVLSRPLATVFAIILPVLAIVLGVITYRVSPLYRQLQTSMDHLNGVVQEDLTAVRAVKAYVRAEHEEAKFDTVNTEFAHTATKTFGNAVLNLPVFQLSMYVAALSILWIGGRMILAGELGVGSLTGFMSYVLLIMNSLMMISNVFLLLTRALASVERISHVLDERSLTEAPAADAAVCEVVDGSVEFRDVSFKYRADAVEDVLEHIDLRIEPGSTVGVLGGTGSGKSSLVQLIARLYDSTEGAVLVGGRDVRDYDLAALRDAVGIVLQKNVLFTGTVRENLQWGAPDATDEELLSACRAACVDEFLDRIGGLDGELGQGGAGVSGGQKQRLCIARTLLKHPRVLIFDDSTSAVDMATDAKIREHIVQIPDTTVIIIAQRIASVMDADRIVVLDDGRVHGVGTHEELLAGDNIYQEIYASQVEFAGDASDAEGDGGSEDVQGDPFSSVPGGSFQTAKGDERHA
ncbi:MAG: ABC transporter ATP-binding protein [Collinsella sp.]|nr:ABC transporter ATP-binding protein [Collinsella sp.]